VGSRIWEFIDGGKTIEDMVSVLIQEYEVWVQQADVVDILNQMEDMGAIARGPKGIRGLDRAFGWLLAWLARGRNRNRIRLMRNLSRVWWFLAGKWVT